jgi:hypothetical protein
MFLSGGRGTVFCDGFCLVFLLVFQGVSVRFCLVFSGLCIFLSAACGSRFFARFFLSCEAGKYLIFRYLHLIF